MPENVFKEAKRLLAEKSIDQMTLDEVQTVKAAMIPLTILPQFNDMTTEKGLESMAQLFDEQHSSKKDRR